MFASYRKYMCVSYSHVKGAWSYFSKFSFLLDVKNHHSKDVNFKFQLKRLSHLDVQRNFVYWYCSCLFYILLCNLNYGYYTQAGYHAYLPNGMISSCGICHGLWEKLSFFCDTKISKMLKKIVLNLTHFMTLPTIFPVPFI